MEDYVEQNFVEHSCETEICQNDDVATLDENVTTNDDTVDVTLEEQETLENDENSAINEEIVENEQFSPVIVNELDVEIADDVLSNAVDIAVDEDIGVGVSTNPEANEFDEQDAEVEKVIEISRQQMKAMKQFRVSSPSYQAVQVCTLGPLVLLCLHLFFMLQTRFCYR